MTKECKQQFTLRITQANPTELVVILYEMTLEYLKEARQDLEAENIPGFREALRKTRGCVAELMESLHLEYEPAPDIYRILIFCMRRIAHGEIARDGLALSEVERVLKPLHDAFETIQGQNPEGPVMGNSQTVYAGLTYGRTSLVENAGDGRNNRGFLA